MVLIDKDHLYYGAAVIQIAEHPSFTAINDFKRRRKTIRCAYWVNQDIGIYLKYRTNADREVSWGSKDANEYDFVFTKDSLTHLAAMSQKARRAFVGFVCVQDKQICCLSVDELNTLIAARRSSKGAAEAQYTIVVALPEGSKFRVYVTPPNRRNKVLGRPILVARKDFPDKLFR